LKKYIQDYGILFLVSGAIVFLDQMTKTIVRANLGNYEIYRPDLWLTQYVRFIHIHNTGAAFGLFQRFGGLFTILSFIVGGFILYYFPRIPRTDWVLRLALCLQFAGAVGNLLDRLNYGYVSDFISILNFPVFNLADLSISIGVALLIIVMWVRDRDKKKTGEQAEVTAAALPEDVKGE
jgi:signal peptidase II